MERRPRDTILYNSGRLVKRVTPMIPAKFRFIYKLHLMNKAKTKNTEDQSG